MTLYITITGIMTYTTQALKLNNINKLNDNIQETYFTIQLLISLGEFKFGNHQVVSFEFPKLPNTFPIIVSTIRPAAPSKLYIIHNIALQHSIILVTWNCCINTVYSLYPRIATH